jgi:copper chaperone NosL
LEPFVPPILGENRVANFVTNSSFLSGAWLVGAAFLLLLYPLWRDRRR